MCNPLVDRYLNIQSHGVGNLYGFMVYQFADVVVLHHVKVMPVYQIGCFHAVAVLHQIYFRAVPILATNVQPHRVKVQPNAVPENLLQRVCHKAFYKRVHRKEHVGEQQVVVVQGADFVKQRYVECTNYHILNQKRVHSAFRSCRVSAFLHSVVKHRVHRIKITERNQIVRINVHVHIAYRVHKSYNSRHIGSHFGNWHP